MKPYDHLEWDPVSLACELKFKDVTEFYRDGRNGGPLLEKRVIAKFGYTPIGKQKSSGADALDEQGNRWEIRSITARGVHFRPSAMTGSGRKFKEAGFLQKLNSIQGYILGDIQEFPVVPIWFVSVDTVQKWYKEKLLGKTATSARKKIRKLIAALPENLTSVVA